MTKPEDIALEESSYAKELEEELALGSGDSATGIITSENEPIGCWSQFIRTLSSEEQSEMSSLLDPGFFKESNCIQVSGTPLTCTWERRGRC